MKLVSGFPKVRNDFPIRHPHHRVPLLACALQSLTGICWNYRERAGNGDAGFSCRRRFERPTGQRQMRN